MTSLKSSSGLKKMVDIKVYLCSSFFPFYVWFLGRQINEEEYKEKCGGGPPDRKKCPKIEGIKRVNSSCADKETLPGGRCKLECEESGVKLGDGHEMHGHLVCEKKDGGVSFVNISIWYPTPRNALSVRNVFYPHLTRTHTNLICERVR